jgi:reverse transcriptase-like protein
MLCQWAEQGVIPSLSSMDNLPRPRPNHKSVRKNAVYMRAQLGHMCDANVASPVSFKPAFVMPLKLVPKSNGKPRMVYNSRKLNKRTRAPHFRMPTPHRIVKHIPRGSFMTRLDISNAYWSIPIHPEHRHLFGFSFEGQYYVWNVLPFGWNVSAWVLSQMLEHVKLHLRRLYGINLFIYSDDILIIAPDAHTSRLHTDIVLSELAAFGFAVQPEKCELEPAQRLKYLGMLFDSVEGTVSLTQARQRAYVKLLHFLRDYNSVPRLWLEQTVGYFNFVAPTWPGSRILFTRWIRALADTPPSEAHVPLDHTDTAELLRLIRRNHPYRFIPAAECHVYSDATCTQGGICWSPDNGFGVSYEYDEIFVQETRAAAHAITLTARRFPGTRIVAHIDNQAALGAIRKGSSGTRAIWRYLRRIFKSLYKHDCSLSLRYIRSAQNPADAFSRMYLAS